MPRSSSPIRTSPSGVCSSTSTRRRPANRWLPSPVAYGVVRPFSSCPSQRLTSGIGMMFCSNIRRNVIAPGLKSNWMEHWASTLRSRALVTGRRSLS